MDKYTFVKYQTTRYQVDPVFKSKKFSVYGSPGSFGPDLFEAEHNGKVYSYCLVDPREVYKKEELLLKIKRYLIANDFEDDGNYTVNTFFFGDMEKSVDVSSEFSNQNIFLVTYEMLNQWYPRNLFDVLTIIVKYLSKIQKHLGQHHVFSFLPDDILFTDDTLTDNEKRDYRNYLYSCMKEEGYAVPVQTGIHNDCFVLSSKALSLVDNVIDDKNKAAFIAIKFDGNEERINAIQNAIAEAGYEPIVMNQVETNNWIMPEIFYRIKNSRFVVVDFSVRCDGAYYEAGYAAALSKPVIHLFDSRENRPDNKLHFDIAQKSTIFYNNFDELKQRLTDRIKATIK